MKYWDEYQTKWGFSDGDATPPDARACRHVYVREINKLAKKYGSKVRLVAWDRPGPHNCYLILVIPAAWVKYIQPSKLCTGAWEPHKKEWDQASTDDAMDKAIEQAFDMDLDSYVDTKVTIR